MDRRSFLSRSAGVGVALAASKLRAAPINEQLNVGFIGLGVRGNELLEQFGKLPDVRIAALCDPDRERLGKAAASHPGAATHTDLRLLIEDSGVDAVVIATCNHWHALAAIWACQAGKDVYVEKPLAHNHWEGQQVVLAARKYDRIVQIGTQQRSDPLQDELKEYLHGRQALGAIESVRVCRFGTRGPIGKRRTPLRPPSTLNYNLWLGPAAHQPLYRDKLHYDWHWDWNTGNGEMGNWGVHVLDDALNVVLRDRVAFPKRIAAGGGRVAWDDAGRTPNVCFAYYDTGTVPLLFALSNLSKGSAAEGPMFSGIGTGYVIHCEGGYYAGGRGGGTAHDTEGRVLRRFRGDAGAKHARNFVDAVFARDRSRLNAEVQIGHQSTAWCNLVDVAVRVGRPYAHADATALVGAEESWVAVMDLMEQHLSSNAIDDSSRLTLSPMLQFDAASEQFVGNGAAPANRLLHRAYRPAFEVPAMG